VFNSARLGLVIFIASGMPIVAPAVAETPSDQRATHLENVTNHHKNNIDPSILDRLGFTPLQGAEFKESSRPPWESEVPWADLFVVGTLTYDLFAERERRLLAMELDPADRAEIMRQRADLTATLFQERYSRDALEAARGHSIDVDIANISEFLLQRDAQYPELVAQQMAFFDGEHRSWAVVDDALNPDLWKTAFWDISLDFYQSRNITPTTRLVPGFLRRDVLQTIAQHYFDESKEG